MIDVERLVKETQPDEDEEIQRQIRLPWPDAFRISMRNVTLRLGRAAITATGVVLGIAFLMSVWTASVIKDAVREEAVLPGTGQIQQQQALEKDAEAEAAAAAQEAEQGETPEQSQARQTWLVIMSLLVCGVGITNSMLMSVTERFQEIGTMKCLGALDEFIVRLFLIETAVLGLLGSLVGAIVGHLIMLAVYVVKEGASVTAKMDWGQMLIYLAIGLAIGIVISLAAAIAPAVRAARMAPAAALQTEI
jgi:predicted lysophospholipase L1 biosynthesis ABC-type transport system permease subunit